MTKKSARRMPEMLQDQKIRHEAVIDAGGFRLNFGSRTYVMGILNVTPDSFSDGGMFFDRAKAVERGLEMAGEGADIIDVGGESTRPGAADISIDEELERTVPVIDAITKREKIAISIDTRKSKVAGEAVRAGASIINDISGLRYDPAMGPVAASTSAALVVMHIKGTPKDMQLNPVYIDVVSEIAASLRESIDIARASGISEERIIIDPGIGFGKTVEHNLEILNRLNELKALGRPICVGPSRKSFIGKILGIDRVSDRLIGTLAACVAAIMKGAGIVRVHDVKEACQAARMADSIMKRGADRWS